MVIAVAIDEDTERIRELAEGITYPVLMDPTHVLTDLYAISNVPSVLWIDADGRIARPNANEFGTDMWSEITGFTRADHFDQVRAWVRDDVLPDDAGSTVADLSADEEQARLHFLIGSHWRSLSDAEGAERHFEAAVALTPLDFTVARAAMPLRGKDPFGEEFMVMMREFAESGAPFHGISRRASS